MVVSLAVQVAQCGLRLLRCVGTAVNIGGVGEKGPLDVHWMMDEQIEFIGSNWFSPGDGQALADMARAGTLDLSVFEHQTHKLGGCGSPKIHRRT